MECPIDHSSRLHDRQAQSLATEWLDVLGAQLSEIWVRDMHTMSFRIALARLCVHTRSIVLYIHSLDVDERFLRFP